MVASSVVSNEELAALFLGNEGPTQKIGIRSFLGSNNQAIQFSTKVIESRQGGLQRGMPRANCIELGRLNMIWESFEGAARLEKYRQTDRARLYTVPELTAFIIGYPEKRLDEKVEFHFILSVLTLPNNIDQFGCRRILRREMKNLMRKINY